MLPARISYCSTSDLELDEPHHVPRTWEGRRRNVTVTLCGDRRGRTPMHRSPSAGRDPEVGGAPRGIGLNVRPAKAGRIGLALRVLFQGLRRGDRRRRPHRGCGADPRASGGTARARADRRLGNSLPFTSAAAVRAGNGDVRRRAAATTSSESVERVPLEAAGLRPRIEATHNFIAAGLVTHNSIYGFRGADITNILNFEDDYLDAHGHQARAELPLDADDPVRGERGDGEQPRAKAKTLWTELGEGDQIKVRELADEHAEARFVAAEIERLVDEGVSRAEIAVFYRMNAQSRVLEDMLVRAQIGYQVIGGTKFYERAEVKDAVALPHVPRQPGRRRRVHADRQLAQARASGRRRSRACSRTPRRWASRRGRRPRRRRTCRRSARRGARRSGASCRRWSGCASASTAARRSRELLEELLRETGYLDALEAERTIEAQGRIENLAGARARRARVRRTPAGGEDAGVRRVPAADRAARRRRPAPRRRGPRDADDAPQRQGPRVPDRVHHRLRGRRVPALARARRGRRWRRSAGSPTSASRARCATSTSPTRGGATCSAPSPTACARASSTRSRAS